MHANIYHYYDNTTLFARDLHLDQAFAKALHRREMLVEEAKFDHAFIHHYAVRVADTRIPVHTRNLEAIQLVDLVAKYYPGPPVDVEAKAAWFISQATQERARSEAEGAFALATSSSALPSVTSPPKMHRGAPRTTARPSPYARPCKTGRNLRPSSLEDDLANAFDALSLSFSSAPTYTPDDARNPLVQPAQVTPKPSGQERANLRDPRVYLFLDGAPNVHVALERFYQRQRSGSCKSTVRFEPYAKRKSGAGMKSGAIRGIGSC